MNINHLIILCKNAVQGKVKTRLAAEIGDENALVVYKALLEHTASVTKMVMAQRKCYYSEFVENNDFFDDGYFEKLIQKGEDLGEKMYNAAKNSFGEWASKVILIGSDCYEINAGILEEAFRALDESDFVIGPAQDGGYYLIGMKELHQELFLNKEWSHENVMLDTLLEINQLGKSHYILPTLSDVDHFSDLPDEIKPLLE